MICFRRESSTENQHVLWAAMLIDTVLLPFIYTDTSSVSIGSVCACLNLPENSVSQEEYHNTRATGVPMYLGGSVGFARKKEQHSEGS
jgi:hypothetical protein